ncbi:MAG TPA: DUF3800 domain-containing protein [Dyella sp.]|nr:DUF3800 domain-containing protein [Dyella sp.]
MERLHVFVDEYGDANLDVRKPGVSAKYIVAALCVRDRDLDKVRTDCEAVRLKNFQGGEMKSSAIANNDGRRIHILRALSKLDAFVIAYCANKELLDAGTGLAFKKSFIKYFARQLYERVARCGADIRIVADQHGGKDFQDELKSYLEGKFKTDLFASTEFSFVDSKADVLLQVSDLYAGALARVYDEKKRSERFDELHAILRDRVSITLWPSGIETNSIPFEEHLNADDELIRQYCTRRARSYIESAGQFPLEEREEQARAVFLDILLANHTLGEPDSFVSTSVLLREISAALGEPCSQHRLRSVVVAKLRDADVIISSCAKGYRIPTSIADLREFAAFANSQIPPMVARLGRARKGVREATLGRVDMLYGEDFRTLRGIVETVSF